MAIFTIRRPEVQEREQILVIKHGALGDIVLATGPLQAIRERHEEAEITLLTAPAYATLLHDCPFIDELWLDSRPRISWNLQSLKEVWRLVRLLRSKRFNWVYDLQTSSRSSLYYRFMRSPKPFWSGIAVGASHRHDTAERTKLHTVERQRQQLALAGIPSVPPPTLDWLRGQINDVWPKRDYVLLVPGGSAHRPEKRWPVEHYSALALAMVKRGLRPVLIGGPAEADVLEHITQACPDTLNLCGQTDFGAIVELARKASFAVGNDTGPMHLIATAGSPSLVLFSSASDPALCAPRGRFVQTMREPNLADLSPERVVKTVWQQMGVEKEEMSA